MFNILKATSPAPVTTAGPTRRWCGGLGKMRGRLEHDCCLFMKMTGLVFRSTRDLVGGWRLQHVAQEYRTVADHQFSTLQTIENLNLAVSSQAVLMKRSAKWWRSVVTQAAIVPSGSRTTPLAGTEQWLQPALERESRSWLACPDVARLWDLLFRNESLRDACLDQPSHKSSKPFP